MHKYLMNNNGESHWKYQQARKLEGHKIITPVQFTEKSHGGGVYHPREIENNRAQRAIKNSLNNRTT